MERQIAERLMKIFHDLDDPLNEATALVGQLASEKEQKMMRRGLGEITGRVYTDLMIPIIREYPDLDPDRDPA